MPSTFVHGFLPSSCLLVSKGIIPKLDKKRWFFLFAIAFIAGNMPDLDLILGLLWQDKWHYFHRNYGHNIFAICMWATLTRFLLIHFVSQEFRGFRGWVISFSLLFSHVIFDAMGGSLPNDPRHGVPLFFPFSEWEFLLPIEAFEAYKLSHDSNLLIAHIRSASFWKNAFFSEIFVSLVIFASWCVTYFTTRFGLHRLRKTNTTESVPSESNVA